MKIVHRLLESSGLYAVNQLLARPTTDRFRQLIRERVGDTSQRRVLDVGCGIGNYRDSFGENYVGVDINPDYIETARRRFAGRFEVMDAADLHPIGGSFDDVVTIATTHHLTDEQFVAMVGGGLRLLRKGGAFHIIDAILPVSPNVAFKSFWFALDRGRYPRRIEAMRRLASRAGLIADEAIIHGPLHDTAYLRVVAVAGPAEGRAL
jgi:SAM-dependent methyltransferase